MATKYFKNVRSFSRNIWLYFVSWATLGFAYAGIYLVLFNLYLLRLDYGYEFIGLVNGAGMIAFAIFSLPAGSLGKRWGSRRMMIIGMGLMVVGFCTLPLAEFLPVAWQSGWILVTWVLLSFFAPLFTVNSAPFLMRIASPKERDYAFSMQWGFNAFAAFIGGMIAGFLPGLFSSVLEIPSNQPEPFRYSLLLAGILLFVGLLATIATHEGNAENEPVHTGAAKSAGPMPLALFSILAIIMFLRAMGEWAPNSFFNVYLETGLNVSTAMIGSLVAIGRLMSGIAALSMPLFVKRWGKKRVIGWGIMGVALSLLPLALIPHWGAAELGFIGTIALSTLVGTTYIVFGQELVSPAWQAVMAGIISMGMGMGGSFIVIAGGPIITVYGYTSFFLTAACLTALGGLLFLFYFRKPRGVFARKALQEPTD
jgi:MFS family permease